MVDVDQETVPPSATKKKQLLSSAMQRTNEWVFSQEIPSDITVQVGEAAFSLHKFPLVSKCGLLRKLLSKAHGSKSSLIKISDLPGGAEAFELVSRFCYGINFEINTENLAMLRCASEYLSMTEDYLVGNLVGRTEAYLEEVVLMSLSGAITVLHKSEGLLPMSEKLKLVSRCIDAIAYIVCKDSQFETGSVLSGSQSQPRAIVNWCAEELTVLRIDTFQRVLVAMNARGFKQYALGPVIMLYAQKSLRGLDIFGRSRNQIKPEQEHEKRVILEIIIGLLPKEKNAIPVSFLSMLLRAAVYLETTIACRLDLEKRMSLQLDQAVLDDLLVPSLSSNVDTTYGVDTVQRILTNYLDSNNADNIEQVVKLMENYLAEIASDHNLTAGSFISLAELIPEQARDVDDGMYRGIDIYLKAHPWLSDTERKSICSLMNCRKLSREACAHAAKNERLPAHITLQVLHYERQHVQNSSSHRIGSYGIENCDQHDNMSRLKKENNNLKLEVMRLQMQLKELKKCSANSTPVASWKSPSPKKSNIVSSVTKKLGRLFAFVRSDSAKTKTTTTTPKTRRHSIS